MRFKPPPDDPRKQKEEEKRRQRKAALIPVFIAMLLIVGVATWTFFQRETAPLVARPPSGELALTAGMPGSEFMPGMPLGPAFSDEPRPQNATGLMLIHPGDDALESEPADLAPMTDVKTLRISGVARDAEGVGEWMVNWSIDASTEAVLKHYRSQAESAGFKLITEQKNPPLPTTRPTTQPAPTSQTLLFFRQLGEMKPETPAVQKGPQVLIVRATPQSDGTQRLLLWLRYSAPVRSLPAVR